MCSWKLTRPSCEVHLSTMTSMPWTVAFQNYSRKNWTKPLAKGWLPKCILTIGYGASRAPCVFQHRNLHHSSHITPQVLSHTAEATKWDLVLEVVAGGGPGCRLEVLHTSTNNSNS